MKPFCSLLLAAVLMLGLINHSSARLFRSWSYQELLDGSDLVVIAVPNATDDTQEHINLPGFAALAVNGIETKFSVSAVLKGDPKLKNFMLHHYRISDAKSLISNGPSLVSFDLTQKKNFMLFLHKETDGRYVPVVGQTDPAYAILELHEAF